MCIRDREVSTDGGKKYVFSPPAAATSQKYTAIVYAGMEYAVWVEIMDGHYTIGGAFEEYRTRAAQMIKDRIRGL